MLFTNKNLHKSMLIAVTALILLLTSASDASSGTGWGPGFPPGSPPFEGGSGFNSHRGAGFGEHGSEIPRPGGPVNEIPWPGVPGNGRPGPGGQRNEIPWAVPGYGRSGPGVPGYGRLGPGGPEYGRPGPGTPENGLPRPGTQEYNRPGSERLEHDRPGPVCGPESSYPCGILNGESKLGWGNQKLEVQDESNNYNFNNYGQQSGGWIPGSNIPQSRYPDGNSQAIRDFESNPIQSEGFNSGSEQASGNSGHQNFNKLPTSNREVGNQPGGVQQPFFGGWNPASQNGLPSGGNKRAEWGPPRHEQLGKISGPGPVNSGVCCNSPVTYGSGGKQPSHLTERGFNSPGWSRSR